MDAQTQSTIESLAAMGFIPPLKKGTGPRPAASYRGARRNHVKAHRQLPVWRQITANYANHKADVAGRAVIANGAREAAAKALIAAKGNPLVRGLPDHVIATSAVLDHYRTQKRTRSINRIIRDLERQIRTA